MQHNEFNLCFGKMWACPEEYLRQLLHRPAEDPGEGCVFLWVEVFGRQDNGEVGHLHMTQAQKHTELS